jgi:hypothetical protein
MLGIQSRNFAARPGAGLSGRFAAEDGRPGSAGKPLGGQDILRWLLVVCLAVLTLTASWKVKPALAAGTRWGQIAGTEVRMRSGPGTSFDILGYFTQGEIVQIVGNQDDEWYKVRRKNQDTGWVAVPYCKDYTPAEGVDPFSDGSSAANTAPDTSPASTGDTTATDSASANAGSTTATDSAPATTGDTNAPDAAATAAPAGGTTAGSGSGSTPAPAQSDSAPAATLGGAGTNGTYDRAAACSDCDFLKVRLDEDGRAYLTIKDNISDRLRQVWRITDQEQLNREYAITGGGKYTKVFVGIIGQDINPFVMLLKGDGTVDFVNVAKCARNGLNFAVSGQVPGVEQVMRFEHAVYHEDGGGYVTILAFTKDETQIDLSDAFYVAGRMDDLAVK